MSLCVCEKSQCPCPALSAYSLLTGSDWLCTSLNVPNLRLSWSAATLLALVSVQDIGITLKTANSATAVIVVWWHLFNTWRWLKLSLHTGYDTGVYLYAEKYGLVDEGCNNVSFTVSQSLRGGWRISQYISGCYPKHRSILRNIVCINDALRPLASSCPTWISL